VKIIQAGTVLDVCDKPDFDHEPWSKQAEMADAMFEEVGLAMDNLKPGDTPPDGGVRVNWLEPARRVS
jgi:hypothetical protein